MCKAFDPPKEAGLSSETLLAAADSRLAVLAAESARREPQRSVAEHGSAARRETQREVFAWACRCGGRLPAEAFSELVDRLGLVHQHLLGLRLVRGRGGAWKTERSQTVRKAAGVFYTPRCVARYIVRQCLGPLLDDHGPSRNGPSLKILDPACGCGSFLLEAYRRLLDWYGAKTLHARRMILKRHVFGLDVDAEAVAVARRALWLEMVGRTRLAEASIRPDDLAGNVCSGDFLLAERSAEPAGPFHVLIGNPPYRRELGTKRLLDRIASTEFGRRHRAARMDLWYYFLHRGLEMLAEGGTLSFILPAYWTAGAGAAGLIESLRRDARIEEIFLLDDLPVFADTSGRHMILRVSKTASRGPTTIRRAAGPGRPDLSALLAGEAPTLVFRKTVRQLFRDGRIDLEPPADELLAELSRWPRLDQLGKVRQGIAENPATINRRTNAKYDNRWTLGEGVFSLRPDEVQRLDPPEAETRLLRPYHDLCDLGRYRLEAASRALIYSTGRTCPRIDDYPALAAHLARFRPIMEARRETRRGTRGWWQLHWPREESLWRSPKLIAIQMSRRPAFVPAVEPVYVPFSVNVFVPSASTGEHLNYLAALLNSRLMWRWYAHHAKRRGVGLEINGHVLAATPIRRIDFSLAAERNMHDRLVELVERMTSLEGLPNQPDREPVEELDHRIDELVEGLYGVNLGT